MAAVVTASPGARLQVAARDASTSLLQESNLQPPLYESGALPIEAKEAWSPAGIEPES